jgi:hypothetical protein
MSLETSGLRMPRHHTGNTAVLRVYRHPSTQALLPGDNGVRTDRAGLLLKPA